MNLRHYTLLLFLFFSFLRSLAQEKPQDKVYSIDFSNLNKPPEASKKKDFEMSSNSNIKSLGFLRKPTNLSESAVGDFAIKSIIDIDNFGNEQKQNHFGKVDTRTTKTYLDVNNEHYALRTDSVDFFYGDIDLDEYKIQGEFFYFLIKDSKAIDGDVAKIVLNGKVIFSSIRLTGKFRNYQVALDKGKNKIEIVALNDGTSSPLTIRVVSIDKSNNNIFDRSFNIALNYKATFHLTREN